MRAVGVKSYSAAVWNFRLTSSRFLPKLAVSHGGGEADRVAQPPPWRFQDFRSDEYITAVCMTVTAVQGTRQVMRYFRNVGKRARSPFAGNGGDRTQEVLVSDWGGSSHFEALKLSQVVREVVAIPCLHDAPTAILGFLFRELLSPRFSPLLFGDFGSCPIRKILL
jgi:hypothetical protein